MTLASTKKPFAPIIFCQNRLFLKAKETNPFTIWLHLLLNFCTDSLLPGVKGMRYFKQNYFNFDRTKFKNSVGIQYLFKSDVTIAS